MIIIKNGKHFPDFTSPYQRILWRGSHSWTSTHCFSTISNIRKVSFVLNTFLDIYISYYTWVGQDPFVCYNVYIPYIANAYVIERAGFCSYIIKFAILWFVLSWFRCTSIENKLFYISLFHSFQFVNAKHVLFHSHDRIIWFFIFIGGVGYGYLLYTPYLEKWYYSPVYMARGEGMIFTQGGPD